MIEKLKNGLQKIGSYAIENPLKTIAIVAVTCAIVWAVCFIVRQIKRIFK